MPLLKYEDWAPSAGRLDMIAKANAIITEYRAQGFDLTLRQLYYQFVSRDWIANKVQEYKRLGDIISKGRRAGLIDWNAIVDRTRNLQSPSAWNDPSHSVASIAEYYAINMWANQPYYVEVWFEKDALMGVFERPAEKYRVPFFSCRGYTSDSEIWGAAQRIRAKVAKGKTVLILHFGDHDPSGIDMSRDIEDRLLLFGARRFVVKRLALNMDQVEQYDPPPNPAKESDSRFANYQAQHGDESWELDALEPTVLFNLVRREISSVVDKDQWEEDSLREQTGKVELEALSENYKSAIAHVRGNHAVADAEAEDFEFDASDDEDEVEE